jgi:hypothetical protein
VSRLATGMFVDEIHHLGQQCWRRGTVNRAPSMCFAYDFMAPVITMCESCENVECTHSARKVSTGSTRAARRAGRSVASTATAASTSGVTM